MNLDLDALLTAMSLSFALAGLVPVFIIKENRRKELTIAVMVSMLIVVTAIMEVRRQGHSSQVRAMQNEIVAKLPGHRWTLDELYRQLHYPKRDVFFEALFGAAELHRVEEAVSAVRIDDGLPVDVRLYWLGPDGPAAMTKVVPDGMAK